MVTTLVLATKHLGEFDSAEIVHAIADKPCTFRWVAPSYETNPIAPIARTRDVAGKNHYKHIHVPDSMEFGLVVINHTVRIPQHAVVSQAAVIFRS